MPKKAKELKPIELSRLTPGRHAVGGVPGLLLQVPDPNKALKDGKVRTSRVWVLRYSLNGRRRDQGLGGYPEVGLAEARDRARKARASVFDGQDPIALKRTAKSAIAAASAASVTFRQAAEDYIATRQSGWKDGGKSADQWRSTLEAYAMPICGDLQVADITTAVVLKVLQQPVKQKSGTKGEQTAPRPLWEARTETASRLRNRIELIIAYSDRQADRERPNPARWKKHLDAVLSAPGLIAQEEHHPALPYADTPSFICRASSLEGEGARALVFCILTAVRSRNAREAQWREVDFDARVWTIPATKMKGKKNKSREHRVPLSEPAIQLLRGQKQGEPDDLIFPGAKGRPLSDATLAKVIERLNRADKMRWIDPKSGREATPHGFRSSFRDWVAEKTSFPGEVAEAALAHALDSQVEAAYKRSDLLERRRKLMDAWAKFVTTPPQAPASATVTPISAAKRA
jgi:integrase